MYQKGDCLACGNKGVCMVEDITTLNISGVDKEREYYILKPVYSPGSTVYVPISSGEESLRKVLSHEEAERLLDEVPLLSPLVVENDKLLEQEYRSCMKTNNCKEWARMLKTICFRRQKRLEEGRKQTAVDAKYFRLVCENLYGELAVSLSMGKNKVEDWFMERITEEMKTTFH